MKDKDVAIIVVVYIYSYIYRLSHIIKTTLIKIIHQPQCVYKTQFTKYKGKYLKYGLKVIMYL